MKMYHGALGLLQRLKAVVEALGEVLNLGGTTTLSRAW